MSAAAGAAAALAVSDLAPLRDLARALAGPRQMVEQVFLQMGERLGLCAKLLGEVTAAYEGMPAELASQDYAVASQRLHDIRLRVDEMASAYAVKRRHFAELGEMAMQIGAPISDLVDAVRTIELIAINARIVSAGFGARNAEVLVFTTGMAELAKSVAEAVDGFSRSYARLVANVAAARNANADFFRRHGENMQQISGELGEQLSVLERHRAVAATKASTHAEVTGRIRAGIGAAVSAMQIGDITRQRVEHVEQTFDTLFAWRPALTAQSEMALRDSWAAVQRLQAAQLDAAVTDFDGRVAELATTLRRLASEADATLRDSGRDVESMLSVSGLALVAMIADLRGVRVLFEQFERTHAGLERIVNDTVQSVAAMVDRIDSVRSIEQRIRLLSFNTTIQCGRLGDHGEGRALRVVAEQLREVSAQTVSAAAAILRGLNEVEAHTRAIMQERDALLGGNIVALGDEADAAIVAFDGVAGRLRQRAQTMLEIGPETVRLLEETAQAVSDRGEFSATWRRVEHDIAALAARAADTAEITAADPQLLAELRALYTMESERQLHDDLFGEPPSPAGLVPSTSLQIGAELF